jgi:hypothetical protein
MPALCVLVCLLAGSPSDRVRSLDPWVDETLQFGIERSPTFRGLIAELEASDVIVYIQTGVVLPDYAIGTTRLAVSGSQRYVRIVLSRDWLTLNRVTILAHELQHAIEIARSEVQSSDDMQALFDEIGYPAVGDHGSYETEAAISISRIVRVEASTDASLQQ